MTGKNARPRDESPERLLRVQQVLDLCIDRRISGAALGDEQIIAEYPDLMPELGEELRNLAVIERARHRAASSDVRTAATLGGALPLPPDAGPTDFLPGYEILEEIHRGGQGVVYRALQQATRRTVAVKVLLGGALSGPREIARFEREV
ncbi:MAG: hypothetical protein GY953_31400, partial [bacterium]|nr:hypothetical protein [bacterium]